MAEEFGLQEIFRERAAVDGHERRELPAAVEMQRPRDEFLAGAAFAKDQDGAVGVGDLFDQFEDLVHFRRGADDLVELILLAKLLFEEDVFRDGFVVLQRAFDAEFEVVQLERLFEIIVRALFHRGDGGLDRAERGDDDDGGWRVEGAGLLQNLQAAAAGFVEVQVGDDQFRRVGFDAFERGRRGVAGKDLVALGA